MLLKKRFYILPKVGIKGIASIAMVIAISISIIILLTVITADIMGVVFRAWPGTRITIEGMLIKIGGLMFGPFLGIFIGALTDLLSVALTAGVFHYGYLMPIRNFRRLFYTIHCSLFLLYTIFDDSAQFACPNQYR